MFHRASLYRTHTHTYNIYTIWWVNMLFDKNKSISVYLSSPLYCFNCISVKILTSSYQWLVGTTSPMYPFPDQNLWRCSSKTMHNNTQHSCQVSKTDVIYQFALNKCLCCQVKHQFPNVESNQIHGNLDAALQQPTLFPFVVGLCSNISCFLSDHNYVLRIQVGQTVQCMQLSITIRRFFL